MNGTSCLIYLTGEQATRTKTCKTDRKGTQVAASSGISIDHLSYFLGVDSQPGNWKPQSPKSWHALVFETDAVQLPERGMDRTQLKEFAAGRSSESEVFSAIMAWGGMNRRHGSRVAQNFQPIAEIIKSLRSDELSRRDAYNAFAAARRARQAVGLGPAYFTKLIFFASPRHDGYILDQWTGRSVNLLSGREVVKIRKNSQLVDGRTQQNVMITDGTTAEMYEDFCVILEEIAHSAAVTPEQIELRLFSGGGKKAGAWREHLRQYG